MNVLEANLSRFNKNEILAGLSYLVKTERKVTYQVLRFINEISVRKIYLEEGYDSLHRFLVEHHKYSERSALRRINAAKVLLGNPQVSEKIQSGEIKLSQLERVHQCLQQKSKLGEVVDSTKTAEILTQVEDMTTFETERVLAVELDFKPKQFQKVTPQSDGSVRIEITLTASQFAILKKAQSAISHAVPTGDLASAIEYLSARQNKLVEGKSLTPGAGASPKNSGQEQNLCDSPLKIRRFQIKTKRKYIRRSLRRSLLRDSNGRCEHVHPETGRRCNSQFQLQVDHIIPHAYGGMDHPSNLRILCGIHNRFRTRVRKTPVEEAII